MSDNIRENLSEWETINLLKAGLGISEFPDRDYGEFLAKPASAKVLLTTDGNKYKSNSGEPLEIWAYRIANAAISDITLAAPDQKFVLIDLVCPTDSLGEDLGAVANGLRRAFDENGVEISNGCNLRRGSWSISITVVGVVGDAEKLVGRDSAKVGDIIYVSGPFGLYNYAIECLNQSVKQIVPNEKIYQWLLGGLPSNSITKVLQSVEGVTAVIDANDCILKTVSDLAKASSIGADLTSREILKSIQKEGLSEIPVEVLIGHPSGDLRIVFAVGPDCCDSVIKQLRKVGAEPSRVGRLRPGKGVSLDGDYSVCDILNEKWSPSRAYKYPAKEVMNKFKKIGARTKR